MRTEQSGKLSATARALLDDPDNELLFSAAGIWEITIKRGLGRGDFQVDLRLLGSGNSRKKPAFLAPDPGTSPR